MGSWSQSCVRRAFEGGLEASDIGEQRVDEIVVDEPFDDRVALLEEQFSVLTPPERDTAHALIDADIAERVASQRFGPDARTAGHTTVSIDDDGQLIEIGPDGTRRRL